MFTQDEKNTIINYIKNIYPKNQDAFDTINYFYKNGMKKISLYRLKTIIVNAYFYHKYKELKDEKAAEIYLKEYL